MQTLFSFALKNKKFTKLIDEAPVLLFEISYFPLQLIDWFIEGLEKKYLSEEECENLLIKIKEPFLDQDQDQDLDSLIYSLVIDGGPKVENKVLALLRCFKDKEILGKIYSELERIKELKKENGYPVQNIQRLLSEVLECISLIPISLPFELKFFTGKKDNSSENKEPDTRKRKKEDDEEEKTPRKQPRY